MLLCQVFVFSKYCLVDHLDLYQINNFWCVSYVLEGLLQFIFFYFSSLLNVQNRNII